jgi:hypothetical protein
MTDLLHLHNSIHDGLRSGCHRSLLAEMGKTNANLVKGSASRGHWKRWSLIVLGVLLLMPAMQVAVVRFVDPPRTLPMWRLGAGFTG